MNGMSYIVQDYILVGNTVEEDIIATSKLFVIIVLDPVWMLK